MTARPLARLYSLDRVRRTKNGAATGVTVRRAANRSRRSAQPRASSAPASHPGAGTSCTWPGRAIARLGTTRPPEDPPTRGFHTRPEGFELPTFVPGFRLEDIQPEVLIWHGELDRNDPLAMARLQERRLPIVRARYYDNEGHLIFFSRIAEILSDLTSGGGTER